MSSTQKIKQRWLYALLLDDNKYYIGITAKKDPQQRINEHFNGFYTSNWVKRYKPKSVLQIIDLGAISLEEALSLEQKRTEQYMAKYGYKNVRGGSYAHSGEYIKLGNRLICDDTVIQYIGLIVMTAGFIGVVLIAWR